MTSVSLIVLALILMSSAPGKSFFVPRPQVLELSQNPGFINLVKDFFGVPTAKDEEMEALKLNRHRKNCLRLVASFAKKEHLPWMKERCFAERKPRLVPFNFRTMRL